jgi:SAM-dependent methyltransferase
MKNGAIDRGQSFDWGKASKEYAKYRDIYPPALYEKLLALGVGVPGSRWLDLGTGTGVLPRALAAQGAKITGIDLSEEMIAEATALSADMPNIRYICCPAEQSGLPEHAFDAITACMCFWYFDPAAIVPEIRRLLKPGGVFVKIYMSWLKEDPIAVRSNALVKRLNPNWTGASPALKDLTTHYFDNPILDSFTVDLPFTREAWHGRLLANRGVKGSMEDDTLARFESEHRAMLDALPEPFTVRHKIFITAYRL